MDKHEIRKGKKIFFVSRVDVEIGIIIGWCVINGYVYGVQYRDLITGNIEWKCHGDYGIGEKSYNGNQAFFTPRAAYSHFGKIKSA